MSLSESLVDDLAGIGYDPQVWEAPKGIRVIPKGNYRAKLTRWFEATDRSTGALVSPYELVLSVEITQGPQTGRFISYQRVNSRDYKTRAGASALNDFLAVLAKATNHEGAVKGRDAIKQLLDLARDTNAEFGIRVDLEAYDKDYINNIKAEGNKPTNDDYNTARVKGAKNFSENDTVIGPSGAELTAQATVKGFSV
jgi:hypothetical protein